MKIVFDMDNTLVDEFGSGLRPGILNLLNRLSHDGHTLCLWTSSTRSRALMILKDHNLRPFFEKCVFREDYDPENKGLLKDIRRLKGEFLVDDDPKQIEYVKSIKKNGFAITPYRKYSNLPTEELDKLYQAINRSGSFFNKGGFKFEVQRLVVVSFCRIVHVVSYTQAFFLVCD